MDTPTRSSLIKRPFSYAYWNVSLILIGINLLVYLLTRVAPGMYTWLSLNVVNLIYHRMYWQFFTYMFVHGGFTHLLFNMLALFFFGMSVERRLGSKEFLLLYFVSGLFCGIFSFGIYYFTGSVNVFLMGASGAIYAMLLSYAVLFPASSIFIWGIIPVPAPILVLVYAAIEILSELFSWRSGVAHMTHLAGFAVAWLYFLVRLGINPWKVWKSTFR
ncbi:MAG: rhomboid family intramembrane serine protease [Spirochaetaceae bacterium]|jgi:membrane associated rhomboid family serine protease|nr:rhomboid family intramembrane serine protease [Spirochaetaceae bacterium]